MSVLNGLLRAPVKTGKTLFAAPLPFGDAFFHADILNRADFGAESAPVTFCIGAEKAVGAVPLEPAECGINESGGDPPKQTGAFFDIRRSQSQLRGDPFDFLFGGDVRFLLRFRAGGAAEWRIIFRHFYDP